MGGRNAGSPGESADAGDDQRFDDAWAQIIAGLTSGAGVDHPHPDQDGAGPLTRPGGVDPETSISDPSTDVPTGPRDWVLAEVTDDQDVGDDPEEGFVPPDPGPVLGGDPLLTMAWAGFVGAPLGVLIAFIVWWPLPPMLLQLAGAVFVTACAVLVWRMPARQDDDDHDPGAVV